MKQALRRGAGRLAESRATRAVVDALSALERRRPRPGTLAVLTYHRIAGAGDRPDLSPSLRSTDDTGFGAQIDRLARHHRFVSVDEVLEWRRTGATAPPGAVLVTFDDAYADVADHAWPILRARGIPAVAFVPTALVDADRSFWWDALHLALGTTTAPRLPWRSGTIEIGPDRTALARRLRAEVKAMPHHEAMAAIDRLVTAAGVTPRPAPVLGWDRLRSLHAEGLVLAPHTRTHAFLDRVDEAEARAEVEGSIADLRAQIGACPPVFAYPSGQWNETARRVVGDAGIEIAMTTRRGVNRVPGADWLTLDRINVGALASPAVLQGQLLWTAGPILRRLAP